MPQYQLDCPFDQKDSAKQLGARWDGENKTWFVPPSHYGFISKFNAWRPNNCIFLNCSFEEKDKVKALGGRWDPDVRHWYITASVSAKKFEQWLPCRTTTSKPRSPSGTSRGNAQNASILKISDLMTVSQLQIECRHRGVAGFSGKSKGWLIDQLGLGSKWLSFSTASQSPTKAAKKPKSESKAKKPDKKLQIIATHKKTVTGLKAKRQLQKTDDWTKSNKKLKAAKLITPTSSPQKKAGMSTAVSFQKYPRIDFTTIPRVSSALTVSQLSHELLCRNPNAKGLSNKSKTWFLSQLGENSVWTTAPHSGADLSRAALISSKLTIAQLVTEIKYRMPQASGLSSKNKQDLLQLAAAGSIWMTDSSRVLHNNGKRVEPITPPTVTSSAITKPELTSKRTKPTPTQSRCSVSLTQQGETKVARKFSVKTEEVASYSARAPPTNPVVVASSVSRSRNETPEHVYSLM